MSNSSDTKNELSREELECLVRYLESKVYPQEFSSPFLGSEDLGEKLHSLYRGTINEPVTSTTEERRRWNVIAK